MTEKRKPIPQTDPSEYPCPLCKSPDYEFGMTYQSVVKYEPLRSGVVKELKAILFPKRTIKCRVCRNCGHLMFLVDEVSTQ